MGIVVGGKHAWRVKRKGDIAIAYHWINREPAMVLFPVRPNTTGATAFCIPIGAAHTYAQSNGYPTKRCIEQAAKAATLMGMFTDRFTIHRIADAILEGIEDLLDMPPEPDAFLRERRGRVVGELSFKSEGRVVAEREVHEHGEEGESPDFNLELPAGTTLH